MNSNHQADTFFAPAERADQACVQAQQQAIIQTEFVKNLMNSMQELVLILNAQRQIIAVNDQLLSSFGVTDATQLIGLRPGEALGCIRSNEGPGGCGTGENCTVCGAVIAILTSQKTNQQARGECRVTLEQDGGTALDLEVMASPIEIAGDTYTIFTLKDISNDKRRTILERVFFHDILNTAGGIQGLASLMAEGGVAPEKEEKFKEWMVSLSDALVQDIQHQRYLLAAERGEFIPQLEQTYLPELLQDIVRLYSNHERTPGRRLQMLEVPPYTLTTDRSILRRIVGNMVLNALEATHKGDTVTLQACCTNDSVRIEVTNPGEIPRDVQLNLFNRSFSTKQSSGRGIGTYSMKLFGERYLGGTVGFVSAGNSTSFFIELPAPQLAVTPSDQ